MAKDFDFGSIKLSVVDNSELVKEEFEKTVTRTLVRWGKTAHDTAVEKARFDTGALRNSIAFGIDPDERTVTVATNSQYAIYNEMGTGKYAEGGGGHPTPWVYQGADGKFYRTEGMKPKPFIRPAFEENTAKFEEIAKEEFGG